MRNSRFTESQIVAILNEAEAGRPVTEVCRKHNISSPTYYKWKANCRDGHLSATQGIDPEPKTSATGAQDWVSP